MLLSRKLFNCNAIVIESIILQHATTLSDLILEATNLVEGTGLKVDGVVTDGASWNRSMWNKFGVTVDNPRETHPCDPERNFWFISDFPHLFKCMRNCIVSHKIMDVYLNTFSVLMQSEGAWSQWISW